MPFLQTLGGGSASGFKTSGGGGAEEWIDANGGTISYSGDYKIHTFNHNGGSAQTLTITNSPSDGSGFLEILMIGGGGGGGGRAGAGGGAGGVVWRRAQNITGNGDLTITVGAGGSGGPTDTYGGNGSNTSMTSSIGINLTAIGGGGAPGGRCNENGNAQGSGAGGTYGGYGGQATAGQGNAGGDSGGGVNGGTCSNGSYPYKNGGGGGYLEFGENGNVSNGGGRRGGDGAYFTISGTQTGYAGGGGGGGHTPWNGSPTNNSDFGGGEDGGAAYGNGGNGVDGKGGGGGGASSNGAGTNSGGSGGDGICIVRYRYQNTTGNSVPGWTQSNPAANADAILAADANAPTGVYWIGTDSSNAQRVFCCMNPNGANSGGWMAIMTIGRQNGGTHLLTANAVGTFPVDNPYIVTTNPQNKLSDADIASLESNHGGSHPYKYMFDQLCYDPTTYNYGTRTSVNGPAGLPGYSITGQYPYAGTPIAAPDCVPGLPQVSRMYARQCFTFNSNLQLRGAMSGKIRKGNTNSMSIISNYNPNGSNYYDVTSANNTTGSDHQYDSSTYLYDFYYTGGGSGTQAYATTCSDSHSGPYTSQTTYNCYHSYIVIYTR